MFIFLVLGTRYARWRPGVWWSSLNDYSLSLQLHRLDWSAGRLVFNVRTEPGGMIETALVSMDTGVLPDSWFGKFPEDSKNTQGHQVHVKLRAGLHCAKVKRFTVLVCEIHRTTVIWKTEHWNFPRFCDSLLCSLSPGVWIALSDAAFSVDVYGKVLKSPSLSFGVNTENGTTTGYFPVSFRKHDQHVSIQSYIVAL